MRRRIRTAHLIPIPFFDRRPRCLVGIAKLSVIFFGERPSPRLLFALSSFLKIPTSFSANGQNHESAASTDHMRILPQATRTTHVLWYFLALPALEKCASWQDRKMGRFLS